MNTSSWKWFYIEEIFDVNAGKYHYKDEYEKGNTPYLSATAVNNGVGEKINLEPEFEGGIITTEKVCCTSFYQSNPFCATSDVNIIRMKDGSYMNKFVGIFIATIIDFNESFRWTYGRQCRVNDTKRIRIKLPVTQEGTPDWKYMEDFVKDQIIPQLPKKAQKVWLKKYDTTPQKQEQMKLNTQDWKWFVIKDICQKPYKATAYNALDLEECNKHNPNAILYVTRTDVNNGCKGYVLNEGFVDVEDGNALTIGDTTATIYYQAQKFICGDHMVVLRCEHFNLYTGLFISTLLNLERFRYNYGRAFNMDIIANTRIKLPVTAEGKPDWQFMEDYIKSLPYSKNLEPSDPNELVDELMDVKRKVIELQRQVSTINGAGTVNIIGGNVTYNDNSKTFNVEK